MKTKRWLIVSLVAYQTLVAGCTGISSVTGSETLTIKSDPSRASVFIMDKKIGETPLEIDQSTLYPNTYNPDLEALYGVVVVRKEGCAEFSRRVGYRDLVKNIEANLECDGSKHQPAMEKTEPVQLQTTTENRATPESAQTVENTPVSTTQTKSTKNRLIELNQLRDDGLINQQEFETIRQRILDSL